MLKKESPQPSQGSPGERLYAIRSFVQSIRKEFCKKTGLSENTLRSWEKNSVPLSEKGAHRLCDVLAKEGILCTPEWLLKGTGASPLTQEGLKRKFDQAFGEQGADEDLEISREADLFLKKYPHSIIMVVLDNAMAPQFERGDYLGGTSIPSPHLEEHLKKACIVELDAPQATLVRTLEKGRKPQTYALSCLNPLEATNDPFLAEANIKKAYEILWFRRKRTTSHTG
jgi:transcriptional regulator with XRE-family HTH domain